MTAGETAINIIIKAAMSKSMVITLGHNASAIVVEDGKILGGYEEERFSKIKSDSSFPHRSLNKLLSLYGSNYDSTCIGHWFTSGIIGPNKYFDTDVFSTFNPGELHSIQDGRTHHDTHLQSAKVFGKHYELGDEYLAVVADGFGTFGECITIYDVKADGHKVLSRHFGYSRSLGMLYQYATAYLGMKMHNHEYKMLGYEAHIHEALTPEKIKYMDQRIEADAKTRLSNMYDMQVDKDTDPIVNKSALAATQLEISKLLDDVVESMEMGSLSESDKRIIVSYYVQSIVEAVITTMVALHAPKRLLVAGGLFYNVKLNHRLSNKVERFCAMPLAGDQGAGLGVYEDVHKDLIWPGHLGWGHRDLSSVEAGDGIVVVRSNDEAESIISCELRRMGMVNVVRGSMEFGPRSLCNTATLAMPTLPVVRRINAMNDRTTVMPMAPAMTLGQAKDRLEDVDKIAGSLEYMIVTRNVKAGHENSINGAAHHYELYGVSTCRPQIIGESDSLMHRVLTNNGPVINTSFNYHGVPIVYDNETIQYSHAMQRKFEKITTVVISL